ncbi:hypothetical protein LEP1GSC062_0394 [Leptospira alexanderi serovar Manhao 3 str. L 60]|uniref:Uncharacterized protein n=1 Tax=Leptospira alexanderi serovar Manhao 3 str. L 60 TaxID=1049759 RepID=V6I421_9LEPT|nr:hypothetical protein LEP1GSC062_0394 [Leptospira alexanderi serovar Manhao 3 str. L 60]
MPEIYEVPDLCYNLDDKPNQFVLAASPRRWTPIFGSFYFSVSVRKEEILAGTMEGVYL